MGIPVRSDRLVLSCALGLLCYVDTQRGESESISLSLRVIEKDWMVIPGHFKTLAVFQLAIHSFHHQEQPLRDGALVSFLR